MGRYDDEAAAAALRKGDDRTFQRAATRVLKSLDVSAAARELQRLGDEAARALRAAKVPYTYKGPRRWMLGIGWELRSDGKWVTVRSGGSITSGSGPSLLSRSSKQEKLQVSIHGSLPGLREVVAPDLTIHGPVPTNFLDLVLVGPELAPRIKKWNVDQSLADFIDEWVRTQLRTR